MAHSNLFIFSKENVKFIFDIIKFIFRLAFCWFNRYNVDNGVS